MKRFGKKKKKSIEKFQIISKAFFFFWLVKKSCKITLWTGSPLLCIIVQKFAEEIEQKKLGDLFVLYWIKKKKKETELLRKRKEKKKLKQYLKSTEVGKNLNCRRYYNQWFLPSLFKGYWWIATQQIRWLITKKYSFLVSMFMSTFHKFIVNSFFATFSTILISIRLKPLF